MASTALLRLLFWVPFSLPLAVVTTILVQPLAAFFTWGTTQIPTDASLNSLDSALLLELPVFLILLAVPKAVIYFWGARRKMTLLNMTTYFVLPIVAWLSLPFMMSRFAWLLIATAAWTGALQIVITPILPERVRSFWRLV